MRGAAGGRGCDTCPQSAPRCRTLDPHQHSHVGDRGGDRPSPEYGLGVTEESGISMVGDRVLARLARIGADPQDDAETRVSKALLVLISVLILPVALLWAILYIGF